LPILIIAGAYIYIRRRRIAKAALVHGLTTNP
jgi:hypothetical protein